MSLPKTSILEERRGHTAANELTPRKVTGPSLEPMRPGEHWKDHWSRVVQNEAGVASDDPAKRVTQVFLSSWLRIISLDLWTLYRYKRPFVISACGIRSWWPTLATTTEERLVNNSLPFHFGSPDADAKYIFMFYSWLFNNWIEIYLCVHIVLSFFQLTLKRQMHLEILW